MTEERFTTVEREVVFRGGTLQWDIWQRLRCYGGKHVNNSMREYDVAGLPPVILHLCPRCRTQFWEYGRKEE